MEQEQLISTITNRFNIPTVSTSRRYWLVRTDSGRHYEDFTINGYISIGWDFISLSMLKSLKDEEIKKIIEQSVCRRSGSLEDDEDEDDCSVAGKVTTIYNKITRFVGDFSIGDIVLAPSRNSINIAIGVIDSDVYEDTEYISDYYKENPSTDLVLCPYKKRRKVNWIKSIRKSDADIYLLKAFSSHHTISNIDDCASFINRTLFDFYATNNEVHAIFHAGHPNGLSLYELKSLVDNLCDIFEEKRISSGLHLDPGEIGVKLNIHSPGLVEIIGFGAAASLVVSSTVFSLNHYRHGGKTDLSFECNKEAGLKFHAISESKGTLQYQQERKRFERMMELQTSLDMTFPEMSTKIIEEIVQDSEKETIPEAPVDEAEAHLKE